MKDIHELQLHESTTVITTDLVYYVLRVPAGWIYTTMEMSIFVPFHPEFICPPSSVTELFTH